MAAKYCNCNEINSVKIQQTKRKTHTNFDRVWNVMFWGFSTNHFNVFSKIDYELQFGFFKSSFVLVLSASFKIVNWLCVCAFIYLYKVFRFYFHVIIHFIVNFPYWNTSKIFSNLTLNVLAWNRKKKIETTK